MRCNRSEAHCTAWSALGSPQRLPSGVLRCASNTPYVFCWQNCRPGMRQLRLMPAQLPSRLASGRHLFLYRQSAATAYRDLRAAVRATRQPSWPRHRIHPVPDSEDTTLPMAPEARTPPSFAFKQPSRPLFQRSNPKNTLTRLMASHIIRPLRRGMEQSGSSSGS